MKRKRNHWKSLMNPNYLGAYSLDEGKDLIVEIQKVVKESIKEHTGQNEEKIICYLVGKKPMILNSTNSKTIAKLLGTPYVEDWVGHKITLFSAQIKAFGDIHDALRVRPVLPEFTVKLPELTPKHKSWEDAKLAIRLGNFTIDTIKKKYSISPVNEKLICENLK